MENFKLKNIIEYSEQELIDLTETQIEKIKKLAINECVENVKKIVEVIDKKIQKARDKDYEKKDKLSKFKKYLDLAEQNKDIAWKFMKEAYSVSTEEEDFINANR